MASGTIVTSWTEGGRAYLALRVDEGAAGQVEYIGSVEQTAEFDVLTKAQQKAVLRDACKNERDGRRQQRADLGISGAVTV